MLMDEIPPELVINFDQTGIHYVPVSLWSMEMEGVKRVEVVGKDYKHQITAIFGISMGGDFLPIQLVYHGKTTIIWFSTKLLLVTIIGVMSKLC